MPVRFTRRPLSVRSAYDAVSESHLGAVALFVGRVRPDPFGRGRVSGLLYEAHVPLASRALSELEREAKRRFGVERVEVWHRLGLVPVGEASVVISVGAGHRAPAFAACRFLIEQLKRKAPIWKTERARPVRRPPPRRGPAHARSAD
ncbi:MAG: molybdenum cofactor biosynthesis protein MoaE [Candidatus Lutacidiplasmatales archaeon]